MKAFLVALTLFCSQSTLFSQVGINTTDPKALFDVRTSDPSNPESTDGVLIPKIDEFPVTAPTVEQDGMLVFITGNGSELKGFYFWDSNTTSWELLVSSSNADDGDWYEIGNTIGPGNIVDNMYRTGAVGIGEPPVGAQLQVLQGNEEISIEVTNTSTSNPNGILGLGGIRTLLSGTTNSLEQFGLLNRLNGSGNNKQVGAKNSFTSLGTGNKIGLESSFANNNGINYGILNTFSAIQNNNQYGMQNLFSGTGTQQNYGLLSSFSSTSSGDQVGVQAQFNGASTADKIGSRTNFFGTASSTNIGSKNVFATTGIQKGNENLFTSSNLGVQYGMTNTYTGTGIDAKVGQENLFLSNSNGPLFGMRNIFASFSQFRQVGVSNAMNSNANNGIHIGMYNSFWSTGNSSKYGVHNFFPSSTLGNVRGTFNEVYTESSSSAYGTYNDIVQNGGSANRYGSYNIMRGNSSGTGNKYGVFSIIFGNAGGTHYGVYSNALKPGSYAGYFLGRVSIGNGPVSNYILPTTRGTFGQVITSGTGGNSTWQDLVWTEVTNDELWEIKVSGNPLGKPQLKYGNTDITGTLSFAGNGTFYGTNAGEDSGMHANAQNIEFISPADVFLARFWEEDNDVIVATISGNGVYTQLSDRQLKTNIKPLKESLQKILSLNGYQYTYKQSADDIKKKTPAETTLGIMADELQMVAPELVYMQDSGNQTINYMGMVPLLIEAIKEQNEQLDQQKAENVKMREEIRMMLGRIEALENN